VKLSDLGEGGLIRHIRTRFGPKSDALPVGLGDDAAVIDIPPGRSLVFCADLVSENTHFKRNLHPPDSIAYRAIAANVSDVAAMGGIASHFLISLSAPGDLDWSWFEKFFDGVQRACDEFQILLAGGDSASSESIFVDVSMIGSVATGHAVRRSGAQLGDGIYVTGMLGGSVLGFERLEHAPLADPAVQRHLFPNPRYRVGAAIADRAHAMIDVSDGLSTDLGHILDESKVSARIYKNLIPIWPGAEERQALHGGEEYELLIIAKELPSIVEGVNVTRIGEIVPSTAHPEITLIDGDQQGALLPQGWQHYRV
jgi:thiamine-monophosphate kinase